MWPPDRAVGVAWTVQAQLVCRLERILHHGEVGIALLTSDVQTPDSARMPLFEAEGWPRW